MAYLRTNLHQMPQTLHHQRLVAFTDVAEAPRRFLLDSIPDYGINRPEEDPARVAPVTPEEDHEFSVMDVTMR